VRPSQLCMRKRVSSSSGYSMLRMLKIEVYFSEMGKTACETLFVSIVYARE